MPPNNFFYYKYSTFSWLLLNNKAFNVSRELQSGVKLDDNMIDSVVCLAQRRVS